MLRCVEDKGHEITHITTKADFGECSSFSSVWIGDGPFSADCPTYVRPARNRVRALSCWLAGRHGRQLFLYSPSEYAIAGLFTILSYRSVLSHLLLKFSMCAVHGSNYGTLLHCPLLQTHRLIGSGRVPTNTGGLPRLFQPLSFPSSVATALVLPLQYLQTMTSGPSISSRPRNSNSPHLHFFTFGSQGPFTRASQGSLISSEAVARPSCVHVKVLLRKARKVSDSSADMVRPTRSRDDARTDSSVFFGTSPLGDPSSLKFSRARGPESSRSCGGGGPSRATIRAS